MRSFFTCVLLVFHASLSAQYFTQYFDGADTTSSSLVIHIDPDTNNVWQIGEPEKTLFDTASTSPYVIITDTVNFYPPNNVSRFEFAVTPGMILWGILAVQWAQKLDFDDGEDGGIVEFRLNGDTNWQNVFNNPYVYNFYGYDNQNHDTLPGGEDAFTGTDPSWKDIWLCFDPSFISLVDTVYFRFTMKSDSVDNQKEGWMIDNMSAHATFVHTVKEEDDGKEYMKVYPTATEGRVYIEATAMEEFHIIESMELIDVQGRVVQRYGISPVKFYIDINDHPNGLYYLKIKTNFRTQAFPVILDKK